MTDDETIRHSEGITMRIIGWPTTWVKEEGLLPIDVQDVDLYLSANELNQLAKFFAAAARELDETKETRFQADFGDSKPRPQTGISLTILVE